MNTTPRFIEIRDVHTGQETICSPYSLYDTLTDWFMDPSPDIAPELQELARVITHPIWPAHAQELMDYLGLQINRVSPDEDEPVPYMLTTEGLEALMS